MRAREYESNNERMEILRKELVECKDFIEVIKGKLKRTQTDCRSTVNNNFFFFFASLFYCRDKRKRWTLRQHKIKF